MSEIRVTDNVSILKTGLSDPNIFGQYKELRVYFIHSLFTIDKYTMKNRQYCILIKIAMFLYINN